MRTMSMVDPLVRAPIGFYRISSNHARRAPAPHVVTTVTLQAVFHFEDHPVTPTVPRVPPGSGAHEIAVHLVRRSN